MKLDAHGDPDPQATDDAVLKGLAVHAQSSAAAMNLGMSAVGSLMAYAAAQCEDKVISADAIEALGWLLAELRATMAFMLADSFHARPETDSALISIGELLDVDRNLRLRIPSYVRLDLAGLVVRGLRHRWFARRIVGWPVSSSMRTDFVLDTLKQDLYAREPERD